MPRLVVCRCDPSWLALAICPKCEQAELCSVVAMSDECPVDPAGAAWEALIDSYWRDGYR